MTTMVRARDEAPEYVLSVRGLRKHFPIREGIFQRVTGHVRAVDGVDLDVRRGETVGLVGESGCGKTTLGRVISGLMPPTGGGVYWGLSAADRERLDELLGAERRSAEQASELARLSARHRIDALDKARWRRYRRNCQMVFQDAFSSLNPRQLVKDVVGRPLRIHKEASGTALLERVVELLESVGLGRQHLYRYPHQFSGGQRQRISIARALALEPELIVLDEPTSALDVSVQAQILNLLHRLQLSHGLTYVFITHDLGVVRHMSDRIVVMYLGQLAETGPSGRVLGDPRHPYTEALLAADPSLPEADGKIRLEGVVPDPARPPAGCRFHTRCPKAFARCGWEVDDLVAAAEGSGPLLEGLKDVHRQSRFAADLVFESEAQASAATAQLGGADASAGLRAALVELRQDAAVVTVRLEEVDPVELRPLGEDRLSACLLAEPGEVAAQSRGNHQEESPGHRE